MSQSFKDGAIERAQLLPTKDTLTALKSDVTLESAILELCDNSLDAWKRSSNRNDKAFIKIEVNQKDNRTELIVHDTAGGIPREDAAMLFGLGQSAKDQIPGAIGTFGVGAKKSLVNLGLPFTVASRDKSAGVGWSYSITEDWFDDDEDWTVPVHDAEKIPPGTTEIRIEDLNYNWDKTTAKELRKRLGQAYNIFLSEKMQELLGVDYDLDIVVDGTPVEPEGMPNWSHSPFDGLYPRRYENIQLESSEFDASVTLNVTVGLLTKKDNQQAGTDIYCQKRKIANQLRDVEGGFGSGKNRIGSFNARHQRLKIIVELETTDDGQALPWDTQKSSIDRHNPIMRGTNDCRGVYNWLRRTAQPFFDLDADRVPRAYLEPYDADHLCAVNEGVPEVYDYSERLRVISAHRPETDLPEIKSLSRKAQSHALLWINCEEALEEWQTDAYRLQLQRESDRNIENLYSLDTLPPEGVENHSHQIAGEISELARVHYHNGVYYLDELSEWQVARYDGFMERHGKDELTELSELPNNIPAAVSDLRSDGGEFGHSESDEPAVYTAGNLEDNSKTTETAEVFLVLGGDGDEERGAKVMEMSRKKLCRQLNLEADITDEVLWEEFREYLDPNT